jgi:hypothetical protein
VQLNYRKPVVIALDRRYPSGRGPANPARPGALKAVCESGRVVFAQELVDASTSANACSMSAAGARQAATASLWRAPRLTRDEPQAYAPRVGTRSVARREAVVCAPSTSTIENRRARCRCVGGATHARWVVARSRAV